MPFLAFWRARALRPRPDRGRLSLVNVHNGLVHSEDKPPTDYQRDRPVSCNGRKRVLPVAAQPHLRKHNGLALGQNLIRPPRTFYVPGWGVCRAFGGLGGTEIQ